MAAGLLLSPASEHLRTLTVRGHVVTVTTRRHAGAWERTLAAFSSGPRIVQPVYRGRAAEVLLPLLRIAREDPSAPVVVHLSLPSSAPLRLASR